MMTTTHTASRPNNITSRTVEIGDVMALGAGTLNHRSSEVVAVERHDPNSWGYVVAIATLANGERETMYGGVVYQNTRCGATDGDGSICPLFPGHVGPHAD